MLERVRDLKVQFNNGTLDQDDKNAISSEVLQISKEISDHNPSDPWPDNINDREKTGQSDENKQILFLVMGGVAVGAGTVLYMMGRSKNSEHAQVTFVPTSAGGELVVGGRF